MPNAGPANPNAKQGPRRVPVRFTLELTEQGRAATVAAQAMRDRHMDEALSYLGQEDGEHLVRILKKIRAFHERAGRGAGPLGEGGDDREGGAPCA